MSKFRYETDGGLVFFFRNGEDFVSVALSDLADLATATQAALAEQNSRAMMAPDCKCGLSGTSPICTEPFTNIGRNCCGNRLPSGMCAHADACHSTQNTENQGE